ncbi:hypothetical protein A0U90_02730 [Kozakia baliensis]|nr:hypothetical protein A0U90_02730 [Kozakia baliensis]
MLADGELKTGQDFYEAAFIEQHGENSDDFLQAHILAMASLAKGYAKARWISAATLDRYLQSIQHPQVFGTQASVATDPRSHSAGAPTMKPFNPALIPDSLRNALGVISRQERRRKFAQGDFKSSLEGNGPSIEHVHCAGCSKAAKNSRLFAHPR